MKYFFRALNRIGWVIYVPLLVGVFGLCIAIIAAPWFGIPFSALFVIVFWKVMFGPMARDERLNDIGVEAEATVLSFQESGSSLQVNGAIPKPGITFTLEVRPRGMPPFQAKVNQYVSMFELQRVQPGATVRVKYDPASPKDLVLVQLTPMTGQYSSTNTP